MAQYSYTGQIPTDRQRNVSERQISTHMGRSGDPVIEPPNIDMGSGVMLTFQCKLKDESHHEPHNAKDQGNGGEPVCFQLWGESKGMTSKIILMAQANRIQMNVINDDTKSNNSDKSIVIGNLRPASWYIIRMIKFMNNMQVSEVEKCISTKPPFGPPHKFSLKKHPKGKFVFTWEKPYVEQGYKIDQFIITVNNYLENDIPRNKTYPYSSDCLSAAIELEEETSYIFDIQACCGDFRSEIITLKSVLPKHEMLSCGREVDWKGLSIYLLDMEEVARHERVCRKKIAKQVSSDIRQREKVVLVVGETGSGKTTWINAALNHILDVKHTDNFRFKLVIEENASHQELSQTQNINIYTIQPEEGCKIDFALTLIDTPGFGDPEGIDKDQAVGQQLLSVFDPQNGFVDHLDAIGFVANGTRPRLTQQQQYIFSSVLDLFGSDVSENIFVLFTFSGKNTPLTMSCVRKTHMPHKAMFKFDNGSVFGNEQAAQNPESSDEDEWEGYEAMAYKMTMKNFKKFFANVSTAPAKSLDLTVDVLTEREELRNKVKRLEDLVQSYLSRIDEMMDAAAAVSVWDIEIESHKNYTKETERHVTKEVARYFFQRSLICIECKHTCHMNCYRIFNFWISGCEVMDQNTKPPTCKECAGKCPPTSHTNVSYYYKEELERVLDVLEDVKTHFEEAKGRKATSKDVCAQLHLELNATEARVKATVSEIAGSLNKLQEIGLNADRMSQVTYIENLIEQEKQKTSRGSSNTLRMLRSIHKELKSIHDIREGIYDPFKDYREMAENIQRECPDMEELDVWIRVANHFGTSMNSESETRLQKLKRWCHLGPSSSSSEWI